MYKEKSLQNLNHKQTVMLTERGFSVFMHERYSLKNLNLKFPWKILKHIPSTVTRRTKGMHTKINKNTSM